MRKKLNVVTYCRSISFIFQIGSPTIWYKILPRKNSLRDLGSCVFLDPCGQTQINLQTLQSIINAWFGVWLGFCKYTWTCITSHSAFVRLTDISIILMALTSFLAVFCVVLLTSVDRYADIVKWFKFTMIILCMWLMHRSSWYAFYLVLPYAVLGFWLWVVK